MKNAGFILYDWHKNIKFLEEESLLADCMIEDMLKNHLVLQVLKQRY